MDRHTALAFSAVLALAVVAGFVNGTIINQSMARKQAAAAEALAKDKVRVEHKCAMHSKVAEVPTKYVDGVGCYEKRFHRWELVQFPED